ncbi:hypothetical protein WDW37_04550 [Bdellovibrionota bacterium FG-1]
MKFYRLALVLLFCQAAVAAPLDLRSFAGNFDSLTLTQSMKQDSSRSEGLRGTAVATYESQVQLSSLAGSFEHLTVNVPSGYSSPQQEIFEFVRNEQGQLIFLDTRVTESGTKQPAPMPLQQNGTTFSGSQDYSFFGKMEKSAMMLDLLDSRHMKITKSFTCCKMSLGHLGCAMTGMCSDVYTLSR